MMPLRALNEFLPRPSATCGGLNRGIRAGQRGRSDGSAGRERKRPGAQPRGWGDGRRRRTAALAIARSRSNRGGPSTTSWTFRGPRWSVRKSPIAGRGVLEAAATITGRRADQRIRASDHLGGGRSGRGDIVPAGSPRVRNEGARGEVHSRRWRTGSTSRRRARAPCTPGRSWPNGSSPARTRRSPSSRSGVTRGLVRCVRRCASAGGRRCEDRGAGRATLSCGRSLCVRTLRAVVSRVAPGRACGAGSETAPTFGDTSLARSAWANERTRADGSEALSHFWPITNSRISESDDTHTSRRRSACTFSGEGRTCRHIWRARHGVASTSPSSLGRRHRRCRCVDPRGRGPWIPG